MNVTKQSRPMPCPHCGEPVRVSKALKRGKSASQTECSNCGEPLSKEDDDSEGARRLRKDSQ